MGWKDVHCTAQEPELPWHQQVVGRVWQVSSDTTGTGGELADCLGISFVNVGEKFCGKGVGSYFV